MKKLTLNNEIKYRVVDRYTRRRLEDAIVKKQRALLVDDYVVKLKNIISDVVSKYIVDPELRALWDKYPRIFKSTNEVLISSEKFGVFDKPHYSVPDDGYVFSVSTDICLKDIKVPSEISSYRSSYAIKEEDIKKIPEKDLEIIKDLIYNIITNEYSCQKALYDTEQGDMKIMKDGLTYQNLFKIDPELYEAAVIRNYSESYLTYEDDSGEAVDVKKQRAETKKANMDKNELALEELKNILNL